MKRKILKMNAALDEKMAACEKKRRALMDDQRTDEAVFQKIEANVYEIFRTVLAAGERACGEEERMLKQFFMKKMEEIPANWEKACETARLHDDAVKIKMESVKLAAAENVKVLFKEIWGMQDE